MKKIRKDKDKLVQNTEWYKPLVPNTGKTYQMCFYNNFQTNRANSVVHGALTDNDIWSINK